MPISALKTPTFRPPKDVIINWNTWRKGLNLLLRENEIDSAELVLGTNLLLTGSGVPNKRWGSSNFFLSSPDNLFILISIICFAYLASNGPLPTRISFFTSLGCLAANI